MLSIPLNGFAGGRQEDIQGVQQQLSIPLNGFLALLFMPIENPLVSFNSIEWIPNKIEEMLEIMSEVRLSIPLNGFAPPSSKLVDGELLVLLSIPLNGF